MQLRLIVACMLALQVVAGYYYDKKTSERVGKCLPGEADVDEEWCRKMLPTYCYDNEEWCCATCKKFASDEPGCKYGDKAEWCAGYLSTGGTCQDENVQKYCCHSCANKLRSLNRASDPLSGPPACHPGVADTVAEFCKTVPPAYCYHASEYCCATCQELNTGSAGCEYGDLAEWCKKYIGDDKTKCSDPNVYKYCCVECGGSQRPDGFVRSAKLGMAQKLLMKLLENSKK